ncbi:MAG: hypothetical protein JXA28_12245 [Bacteroidetes bacterium]|nr:hypothetical protein [Bacteroidota bacterium]
MRFPYPIMLLCLLLAVAACQSSGDDGAQADSTDVRTANLEGADRINAEERGSPIVLDTPVPLRYTFRKGDRFGYRIATDQQVTQVSDTVKDSNHQVITYWYRFEVLEAGTGGGGRLRVLCDRVTYAHTQSTVGRERSMSYDSRADNTPEVDKLYAQYNAPVDTPFEIVVAGDGQIQRIEKLGDVIKNFLSDDYATTKSDYRQSLEQEYANTGLKQVLQLAFQKLPDAPVGKDSSWTIVRPEKLGYLEYRNDAVYRIREIVDAQSGRLAHIDAALTSIYTGGKTMDTGQGIATMDAFDVNGKGLTIFNMDAGRVRRRSLQTDVNVRLYVEPPQELKEMVPESRNFWWTQDAHVENSIEPYAL